MATTLFLQSAVQDPYQLYAKMLIENPVYWDDTNQLWAIYSYEGCKTILDNPSAHIPAIDPDNKAGLNEYALSLLYQLARFSNGYQHEVARMAGMLLFEKMSLIRISDLVEELISGSNKNEIDWVEVVGKRLPVIVILQSFGFNKADSDLISTNIAHLVKITSPSKTQEQVKMLNTLSKEIYAATETHLLATNVFKPVMGILRKKYQLKTDEALSLCVSNLVGLFIQSYDAGRGLLSNSLLQILNNSDPHTNWGDMEFIKKSVIETLRFDPPVHNTRRVAVENIRLGDSLIKQGQNIFVVLAAANRDPNKFDNSHLYNIERVNNTEHLTFGSGGHACLAKHFSTSLAVNTLSWLFGKYKNVRLLERNISYEPMINVRLPQSMLIAVS